MAEVTETAGVSMPSATVRQTPKRVRQKRKSLMSGRWRNEVAASEDGGAVAMV